MGCECNRNDLEKLLKKMDGKLEWAVLEINLKGKEEGRKKYIGQIKKEIKNCGYLVTQVIDSNINNGIYHFHIKKEGHQNA